jgi:hypothetical protein
VVVVKRALHCGFHRVGSGHERFAAFELVDGCALIAQFHDAITKPDDIGKTDLIESGSEAQNRWRGCHCMDSFPSGIVRGNADYSSYQPDSQNRRKLWMTLRRYF